MILDENVIFEYKGFFWEPLKNYVCYLQGKTGYLKTGLWDDTTHPMDVYEYIIQNHQDSPLLWRLCKTEQNKILQSAPEFKLLDDKSLKTHASSFAQHFHSDGLKNYTRPEIDTSRKFDTFEALKKESIEMMEAEIKKLFENATIE
jgi:hypothetical protein